MPPDAGAGRAAVHLDGATLALVLGLLLFGLVMVTSASISIASHDTRQPFLLSRAAGPDRARRHGRGGARLLLQDGALGAPLDRAPRRRVLMLLAVLVPGLGEVVNGGRRWLRLGGVSFQVSELARVLVLIYVASYAARRQDELRETFTGLIKPLLLLALVAVLLLGEPDFGAATVLFATGFGILFIAGARLRYVFVVTAVAAAALRVARRHFRLPAAASDRLPRPLGPCLRQRLSAHPVADRDRTRQMARRRARQQRAEALLPARSAYRFPVRRARRGAGAARCAAHARALRRSHLARVLHRAARLAGRPRLPELPRRRVRALDRDPGLHQHRRQHGRRCRPRD